jgi:hypothetical protein
LINKKASNNKKKRETILNKAEKELNLHPGDVFEDEKGKRYTVVEYRWSGSSSDATKEVFNDNDYLDGEPMIVLTNAVGNTEIWSAGSTYKNWIENRKHTYTKVSKTSEKIVTEPV